MNTQAYPMLQTVGPGGSAALMKSGVVRVYKPDEFGGCIAGDDGLQYFFSDIDAVEDADIGVGECVSFLHVGEIAFEVTRFRGLRPMASTPLRYGTVVACDLIVGSGWIEGVDGDRYVFSDADAVAIEDIAVGRQVSFRAFGSIARQVCVTVFKASVMGTAVALGGIQAEKSEPTSARQTALVKFHGQAVPVRRWGVGALGTRHAVAGMFAVGLIGGVVLAAFQREVEPPRSAIASDSTMPVQAQALAAAPDPDPRISASARVGSAPDKGSSLIVDVDRRVSVKPRSKTSAQSIAGGRRDAQLAGPQRGSRTTTSSRAPAFRAASEAAAVQRSNSLSTARSSVRAAAGVESAASASPLAWWPAPRRERLNLIYAGSLANYPAIVLMFDSRFQSSEGITKHIKVTRPDATSVVGKWNVASNNRMFVMPVPRGSYTVAIGPKLTDPGGRALGVGLSGPVVVR